MPHCCFSTVWSRVDHRMRRGMMFGFVAMLMLTATSVAQATHVIYRQNFNVSERAELDQVGWQALAARKGEAVDAKAPAAYYVGLRPYAKSPDPLSSINAGPSAGDATGVVCVYSGDNYFIDALIYTTQYPIDRTIWQLDSMTFQAARTNARGNQVRAAIRIGETWFVSQPRDPAPLAPKNDPTLFATSANQVRINFSREAWHVLTAAAGEAFAIAETPVAQLPDGAVTAFGVFGSPRSTNGHYLLFDAYTLMANQIGTPSMQQEEVPVSQVFDHPSRMINVRDLGAKGDGLTDDTAAIQQALDQLASTGGTVYIPEGQYRITQQLKITGSHPTTRKVMDHVAIRGAGRHATWLLGDGTDYILGAAEVESTRRPGSRDIIHGMHISDITFANMDAGNAQLRSGGIDASYMIRWSVLNCQFAGLKTGIYSVGRKDMPDLNANALAVYIIRIHNNVFYGCSEYAIKLGRIFDVSIENNEIEHGNGGIAIGEPGDGFDAAANTIRIVNNLIEGLGPKYPAILGSCWVGAQIVGNYLEANMGGDVVLTPASNDGVGRGITIAANTFQPTKEQRETGAYGPIHLRKTIDTVITGNFTTGKYLLHPASSGLGRGINIASNVVRNPPEIGDIRGAKPGSITDYMTDEISVIDAERWEVSGPLARVGLHSLFGLQFTPRGQDTRSVSYGNGPPTADQVRHSAGNLILNQNPSVDANQRIVLGWICIESGAPGQWKPLLADTE